MGIHSLESTTGLNIWVWRISVSFLKETDSILKKGYPSKHAWQRRRKHLELSVTPAWFAMSRRGRSKWLIRQLASLWDAQESASVIFICITFDWDDHGVVLGSFVSWRSEAKNKKSEGEKKVAPTQFSKRSKWGKKEMMVRLLCQSCLF